MQSSISCKKQNLEFNHCSYESSKICIVKKIEQLIVQWSTVQKVLLVLETLNFSQILTTCTLLKKIYYYAIFRRDGFLKKMCYSIASNQNNLVTHASEI